MNRKSMHGCKLDVSSSIAYTGKGSRVGPPPPSRQYVAQNCVHCFSPKFCGLRGTNLHHMLWILRKICTVVPLFTFFMFMILVCQLLTVVQKRTTGGHVE